MESAVAPSPRKTLQALAKEHVMARIQRDHWSGQTEKTYKDLIDAMESEGVDKVNCMVEFNGVHAEVAPAIGEPQMYASVKKEDKPKLLRWLKKCGLGGIVKKDVHPRTLSSTLQQYIVDGGEIPEFITTHTKPSLTLHGIGAFGESDNGRGE